MKQAAVLHLIPRFSTGGAEQLVLAYAKDAKRRGRPVCVASIRDGGELLEAFAEADIPTMHDRSTFYGTIKHAGKLWQYARTHKRLIIHSHVFSADVMAYLLSFAGKHITWISTQHNVAKESTRLRKAVLVWILRRARTVIAVSEQVEKSCERTFRVRPEKIMLIENGILLDSWLSVSPAPRLQAPVQLATIGRLSTQKGHVVLFEALSTLQSFSWQLHLYGDGPIHNALAIKAEQFGIAERVVWHGVRSDLPTILAGIDVVIQPSLWEGRSLVMMETMAAERVVIATTPAAHDLLNDETGYVVPPEDAEALADAIHQVFTEPEEAQDRASEARAYAAAHFDERDSLESIDDLYDTVTA